MRNRHPSPNYDTASQGGRRRKGFDPIAKRNWPQAEGFLPSPKKNLLLLRSPEIPPVKEWSERDVLVGAMLPDHIKIGCERLEQGFFFFQVRQLGPDRGAEGKPSRIPDHMFSHLSHRPFFPVMVLDQGKVALNHPLPFLD